jgi:hypothetical protein
MRGGRRLDAAKPQVSQICHGANVLHHVTCHALCLQAQLREVLKLLKNSGGQQQLH